MAVVMKLAGLATLHGLVPLPHDGQFLQDFDFEANDGAGEIVMTPDIDQAKQFADLGEALAFRDRSPVCKPIRYDGERNRPLTSTNWEFGAVEEVDDVAADG